MRVERFRFKGQEINLPVFDEEEIEKNEIIGEDELDISVDLNEVKEVEKYE